jgi:hypothetical protein
VLELGQQFSYRHLTQRSVLSAVCGLELSGNCSISSDRARRDDRTRWLLDQAAAEAGTTSSLDGADRDPTQPAAGHRPRSVAGRDAPSARAASLASSAALPVPTRCRRGRGPYADPYAAHSRTSRSPGGWFALVMPLVGPVGRRHRGRLAPLGGVERPRRVVRFARLMHRHGRVLGVPSARAASGGNQMPTTSSPSVRTAAPTRFDPSTQRRSAVGVGHAECLHSGCWALRPARRCGCRTGTGRRWRRCGPAARRGQAAPSRALLAGGPARWHREVRRSGGAAGPGAQRTRGGRRRRLTSRQTAAHSRWGSGRRRAKTIVATPRSSWPWRSVWEPGSVTARQA